MAENPQSTDPLLEPYILIPSDSILCLRIRRRRRNCPSFSASASCLISLVSIILSISLLIFFYPTDPSISITHLQIKHLKISPPPKASFDLTLQVNISVQNPNFVAIEYKTLNSSISYRGKQLGEVESGGGIVKAREDSGLQAVVEIDGVRVLDEVLFLIEDLAKGSVPLDTVTEVDGWLGILGFQIPVKGKISCSVNVNPKTQKIIRQDCYSE